MHEEERGGGGGGGEPRRVWVWSIGGKGGRREGEGREGGREGGRGRVQCEHRATFYLSSQDVGRCLLGDGSGEDEVEDTERHTEYSVHSKTERNHEVGHKQDKDEKSHLVCECMNVRVLYI